MVVWSVFLAALCWGSFLNVIAYSLLHSQTWITRRSFCPECKQNIAWYDLVPVISWILLKRRCRSCKAAISWLYPFIELLTAIAQTLAWLWIPIPFLPAYFAFFSALIITIRTDLESSLVFIQTTHYMLPIAFIVSALGYLPLSLTESMGGALFGYGLLWCVRTIFGKVMNKEGLGQGDLDLLSMIGGFIGIKGAWITLTIGSITGLIATTLYLFIVGNPTTKPTRELPIPFGPFLALGAILYALAPKTLAWYLLHI